MNDSKKYRVKITENNASWTTEVIRKVSSKKKHVSKKQSGFPSEKEAQAWGELELNKLVLNQKERNKRQTRD